MARAADQGKQYSGWSQSGTLTTGNAESKFSCQGGDKADAQAYTVQVGVQPQKQGMVFLCTAVVEFSVEGNTVRRAISVGNGISITGVGQAVKVTVQDNGPTSFIPSGNDYVVTINISRGTRAGTVQPPFVYIDTELVGASSHLENSIPSGFGITSVNVGVSKNAAADPAPDVQVEFFAGGIGGTLLGTYDPIREPGWFPVPPSADTISFVNFGAAASVHRTLFFGIDG
jgi:hypothetical protein